MGKERRKKKGKMHLFDYINELFLVIVGLICFMPLLYVFAVSLSSSSAIASGKVTFWPVDFTLVGYEYILSNMIFWRSMLNSFIRVLLGVGLQLIMTCLVAYPLSKEKNRFMARTFFAWVFFIPMMINGGLIPTYLIVKDTGLLDSIWSLIIPGCVPIFFILLLLNFFRQLPKELEEAAIMDGASHWRILLGIFVPLSKPALATIAVYAILGHWNAWFDAAIYMNTLSKFPLLTYMQTIVIHYDSESLSASELQKMLQLNSNTLQSAQIFVATVPVLLTYPFFQKYFTKGLVVGSVKG